MVSRDGDATSDRNATAYCRYSMKTGRKSGKEGERVGVEKMLVISRFRERIRLQS